MWTPLHVARHLRDADHPGLSPSCPADGPVQLRRAWQTMGRAVHRTHLAQPVRLLQLVALAAGVGPVVPPHAVLPSCRTRVATKWMWSSLWRTATHRTALGSPHGASLTASITSAVISARCSSVRIGSSGALRIERCHTVNPTCPNRGEGRAPEWLTTSFAAGHRDVIIAASGSSIPAHGERTAGPVDEDRHLDEDRLRRTMGAGQASGTPPGVHRGGGRAVRLGL
jgi:hypothetical protein